MMGDDDSNDCNDNLQRLTQDEQRQRIFVAGEPEEVKEFVNKVKSQNWCEEANIDEEDNELAQVNFKYPVRSKAIMKIAAQLSPKVIDNSGNNSNSLSQLKQQQQQLELLTSNDKSYNLSKLKKYFKRPLNRFEELRMRKSSSSNSRNNSSSISRESSSSVGDGSFSPSSSSVVLSSQAYEELKGLIEQSSKQSAETKELIKELFNKMMGNNNGNNDSKNSNNFLLLSSQCPQQQQSQSQQQQQQQSKSKMVQEEEESDYNDQKQTQQHCLDKINDNNSNSIRIFKRINELIGKLRVCSSYEDLEETLVNKEGFDFHEVMAVFVNNRHQIDTLIDIFKPKNNNSAQQQQQQTSQNVQQYQQNQQNQQQEIQYPSFIQQGHLFTTQEQQQQQQQKQQEVIEIEDEEKNNNHAQELIQLQGIQNSNEINKPQMNVRNRERSISPLRRQQDAEQKSIDNNRKGYEQRVQKQSYSLSNDPTSKPIRSKSPNNNYSPSQSRSITPQKNPKQ